MRTVPFVGTVLAVLGLLVDTSLGQATVDTRVADSSEFAGVEASATAPGPGSLSVLVDSASPGACQTCCFPCWNEGRALFGEFLYLRPGSDRVPVAVPINGAIVPPPGAGPVQAGNTALADVGFQPGFRFGGSWGVSDGARLGLSYTRFEGNDQLATDVSAPLVLRSMVSHPGTFAAPTDFLAATVGYELQFQFADADYRRLWLLGDRYLVNYVLGARYAHLNQRFDSALSNSTTIESVNSRLTFDGAGLRLGLEGERYAACSGWMIYGSASASFLGGVSRGGFVQRNSTASVDPLVLNDWKEDRVVSILEIEAGIGWTSQSGCLRVKAGYLVTGWFNIPTTDRFIHAVHQNQVDGLDDTLTFDGLSLRTEIRF